MALGLIISYDHPNPLVGGAVLTGTTVILLIAFVTVKIPFTLRMLKASFASVNSSLEEAAAIMGAKTLYVFRRILLPLVLPAAAAITALNFNSLLTITTPPSSWPTRWSSHWAWSSRRTLTVPRAPKASRTRSYTPCC